MLHTKARIMVTLLRGRRSVVPGTVEDPVDLGRQAIVVSGFRLR
jgi:hypothetical protein